MVTSTAVTTAAETGTVVSPSGYTTGFYPIDGTCTESASQILYLASELADATGGAEQFTINELHFPLTSASAEKTFALSVYYTVTDKTSLEVGYDLADLSLVYEGAVSFNTSSTSMDITLDTPITLNAGESLVIATTAVRSESGFCRFAWQRADGQTKRARSYEDTTDITATGGFAESNAVALDIVYTTAGAGGGEVVEEKTGTVLENSWNFSEMYPVNGEYVYSGSQMLYTSDLLSAATGGVDKFSITELEFYLTNKPSPHDYQLQVYYAVTNKTDLTEGIDEADMALVYESACSVGDGNMVLRLDEPIVLNKGENLVLGIKGVRDGGTFWPYYYIGVGQPSCVRAYSGSSSFSFSKNGGYLCNNPSMLTIKYVEGEAGGGSSTSEPKTAIVLDSTGSDTDYYPINGDYVYSGSQLLYSADLLAAATENAEKFNITELKFSQKNSTSTRDYQMQVFFAATEKTDLSTGFAESDLTLVYEGAVTVGNSSLSITLDTPISLVKGDNLVLGIKGTREGGAFWPSFYTGNGQSNCALDFGDSSPFTFTPNGGYLSDNPSKLEITYTVGDNGPAQDPDIYDLLAESISGPATVTAGEPYTYDVKVVNNGNKAIETYNVIVAIQSENGEETTVGRVDNCDRLIKGMSTTIPVEVTLPDAGSFNLVARVFTDPDNDTTNDVSEPLAVTALKLNVKASAISVPETAEIDEEFEVSVTVANEGTTVDKAYTVALVLLDSNGAVEKTLATVTDVPEIAASGEATVKFPLTFNLAGNYNFQGVVKVEGFDATTTEVATVTVTYDKLPGVHEITAPKAESTTAMNNFVTRNYVKNVSQVLYTPEMLNTIERDAQIQSLTFTFIAPEYLTSIPTKIEFASVADLSKLDKTAPVAQELFTTVFDGNITYEPTTDNLKVTVEMGRNFSLKKGESLVIMTTCEGEEKSWTPYIVCANTEVYHTISARTDDEEKAKDLTLYNASTTYAYTQVPVITLGYALEPLPAQIDLEITKFDAPAETTVDDEVTFKVDIRNIGTVTAESYTIELVEIANDDQVNLLASKEIEDALGAGGEAFNQKVKYTFTEPGTYKVAVRVVVADDVDTSNNISESAMIKVDKIVSVENVASDSEKITCNEGCVTFPASAVEGLIVDVAGRVVYKGTDNVALTAGSYVATAKLANGIVVTTKVIVK